MQVVHAVVHAWHHDGMHACIEDHDVRIVHTIMQYEIKHDDFILNAALPCLRMLHAS